MFYLKGKTIVNNDDKLGLSKVKKIYNEEEGRIKLNSRSKSARRNASLAEIIRESNKTNKK